MRRRGKIRILLTVGITLLRVMSVVILLPAIEGIASTTLKIAWTIMVLGLLILIAVSLY